MTYMQFDPNDIFLKLEAAAENMAVAESNALRLEELKGVMLAKISVEFRAQGLGVGECELRAKADPRYSTHIEGMVVAKEKAIRARANYKDLTILAELRRTQESSARTMIERR